MFENVEPTQIFNTKKANNIRRDSNSKRSFDLFCNKNTFFIVIERFLAFFKASASSK